MSAGAGSIGDDRLRGWYAYRASRAAQNRAIRSGGFLASRSTDPLFAYAWVAGTSRRRSGTHAKRATPSGKSAAA